MDYFDGFSDGNLKKWLIAGITYLRDEGILSSHIAKDAGVDDAAHTCFDRISDKALEYMVENKRSSMLN